MSSLMKVDGVFPPVEKNVSDVSTLSNADDTGVLGWTWEIIDQPAGSTAVLITPLAATTAFTYDIEGTYIFKLTTYLDAAKTIIDSVDQQGVSVRLEAPLNVDWRIPAAKETTEFNVNRGWAVEVNAILKEIAPHLSIGHFAATKVANYSPGYGECVPVDASGGIFDVTLPLATGFKGGRILVKDVDGGGANAVTVKTTGGDTINGAATQTIGGAADGYGAKWFESDGVSEWNIIANTAIGGGAGEANLAANVGTGADIWKDKTAVTLNFRGLFSAGDAANVLTIAVNSDNVDFTLNYQEVETGEGARTAYGQSAGNVGTVAGSSLSSFGSQSLGSITTGDYSTALGYEALEALTDTDSNTAVGYRAALVYDANESVFVGAQAGLTAVGGDHLILIGVLAGQNITSADESIIIGYGAAPTLTTGSNCVIIGNNIDVPAAATNDFVNINDVLLIDSSAENVGLGGGAGNILSCTGTESTAVGFGALQSLTSGTHNLILGYEAGGAITTQGNNVIAGALAGIVLVGANNTILGKSAAEKATSADGSTILGYLAAPNLLTGDNNILIGASVGGVLSTGSDCILLGNSVAPPAGAAATDELNIGDTIFGALDTGRIRVGGSGALTTDSISLELAATDSAFLPNVLTTVQRDALASVANGMFIFNSTTGVHQMRQAAAWNDVPGAGAGESNLMANVGVGTGLIYRDKTGVTLNVKSLIQGANITITNNANDITIAASAGVAGETNTSSNLGAGVIVFKQKVGVDFEFKTLQSAGTALNNLLITANADTNHIDFTLANQDVDEATPFKTFFGYLAGQNHSGLGATAFGYKAMGTGTNTGPDNIAIGRNALLTVGGARQDNTVIGGAGLTQSTIAQYMTAVGANIGPSITVGTCSHSVLLGNNVGVSLTATDQDVLIGSMAGNNLTVSGGKNVLIGSDSSGLDAPTTTATQAVRIGNTIFTDVARKFTAIGCYTTAGPKIVGNGYTSTGTEIVAIGNECLSALTSGRGNIAIGSEAGKSLTSADSCLLIGVGAGAALTTQDENLVIGEDALITATNAATKYNTIIGYGAANSVVATQSAQNTIIGYGAASSWLGGDNLVVIGYLTEPYAASDSLNISNRVIIDDTSGNIFVGGQGVGPATLPATGTHNIGIGNQTLASITLAAADNIAIGQQAGMNLTTATGCILIGKQILTAPGGAAAVNQFSLGDIFYGDITNRRTVIGPSSVAIPAAEYSLVLTDTDRAFRPNLMTVAQRGVLTPQKGMFVYVDDGATQSFYGYNGTAWLAIPGAGAGDITGGTSLGAGADIFKQKNGANLEFTSLTVANNDLIYTAGATEVSITLQGFSTATGSQNVYGGPTAGVPWPATAVGSRNVRLGALIDFTNSRDDLVLLGSEAGAAGPPHNSIAIGSYALSSMVTDTLATGRITAIGYKALDSVTAVLGGGDWTNYGGLMAIGHETARNVVTVGSGNILIGDLVLMDAAGASVLGNGNIIIGHNSAHKTSSTVKRNTFVGDAVVGETGQTFNGADNVAIGYHALFNLPPAIVSASSGNVVLGSSVGTNLQSLADSVIIGSEAVTVATGGGDKSVLIGEGVCSTEATIADDNVVVGYQAGKDLASLATASVIIGYAAGQVLEGPDNIFIGYQAGINAATVDDSVLIGKNVGATLTNGLNVILVGNDVDAPAATTNNYLNVGDLLEGDLNNSAARIGAAVMSGSFLTGVSLELASTTKALRLNQLTSAIREALPHRPGIVCYDTELKRPMVLGVAVDSWSPMAGNIVNENDSNAVVVTTTYSAVLNEVVIVDLSGGGFALTLPAAPTQGDFVIIKHASTEVANVLSVLGNGKNVEAQSSYSMGASQSYNGGGFGVMFVFNGGTNWVAFHM